ncbi:MAG: sigma 54-interacting transcriptional regulator [Candidatus Eisenbacteria bacterium]|nr:sigma 54-interacting transcriptional regulator [Candidatus Eisenbacteria bacterium]
MSLPEPFRADAETGVLPQDLLRAEEAILRGDFDGAWAACDALESRGELGTDPRVRAATLLVRCRVDRVRGEYSRALEAGEEAFLLLKPLDDPALLARCHSRLGAVHYRLGNAEDAERHYRAALHLYEWDAPDARGRAVAHNNLGVLFVQRAQWTLALDHLARAIAIAEDLHLDDKLGTWLLNLGYAHVRAGNWSDAQTALERGRELTAAFPLHQARAHIALAMLALQIRDFPVALAQLQAALDIARPRGHAREEAIAEEVWGDLLCEQGATQEALSHYQRGLAIARLHAPAGDVTAEVERRLAQACVALNQPREAIEHAHAAIEVGTRIMDPIEVGAAYRARGEAQLLLGDRGAARRSFDLSVHTLVRVEARLELAFTLKSLGGFLVRHPEHQRMTGEEKSSLFEARNLFMRLGMDHLVRQVDFELSEIERTRGLFVRRFGPNAVEEDAPKLTSQQQLAGFLTLDQRVLADLRVCAETSAKVLLEGETGTGKEMFARSIHALSDRWDKPFVVLDCAALPEGIAESELFGHVRGAFTGAIRDQEGLVLAADGGTFFIDEVGELTPRLQLKLLRLLQEQTIKPVGGRTTREVDIRIIAATNRDLRTEVEAGRFRKDLYYRLKGMYVHLPPLRERREDVRLLAEHLLTYYANKHHRTFTVNPGLLQALTQYDWPGNVRELESEVENLVARVQSGGELTPELLSADVRRKVWTGGADHVGLKTQLREMEMQSVSEALRRHGGNKSAAARSLGITRKTLARKLASVSLDG